MDGPTIGPGTEPDTDWSTRTSDWSTRTGVVGSVIDHCRNMFETIASTRGRCAYQDFDIIKVPRTYPVTGPGTDQVTVPGTNAETSLELTRTLYQELIRRLIQKLIQRLIPELNRILVRAASGTDGRHVLVW